MLCIDVITTDRHVLSACIWISRVQEPEPKAPLPVDARGAGDAEGDGAEGAGEGEGEEPPVSPPSVLPPPDGGADGVATGDDEPADGVGAPPNPPDAAAAPHSRSPTLRSAIMLRFVMSLASARLPYSQPVSGRLMPVTFWRPCCT